VIAFQSCHFKSGVMRQLLSPTRKFMTVLSQEDCTEPTQNANIRPLFCLRSFCMGGSSWVLGRTSSRICNWLYLYMGGLCDHLYNNIYLQFVTWRNFTQIWGLYKQCLNKPFAPARYLLSRSGNYCCYCYCYCDRRRDIARVCLFS